MLKRERYELQVGIVFVAALTFLIVGLLWAKRYRPRQSEMQIEVSFPTVGGLREGDEVLISGLRLGEVSSLQLRERDVLVGALLSRHVRLYEGYQIRIVTLTFTGELGLSITPGTGEPLEEPLPVLKGISPLELGDIIGPGLETFSSVKSVADTLAWALPEVTRRTKATLDRLDSVLAEVQEGAATGKVALRQTLAQARTTLASTDHLVTTLSARLDTSLTAADETFASLKATSDTLRQVIAAFDTTQGALGRLIREPGLYDELRRATTRLDSAATSIDSLAQDIKRNPKRYVRFSLF